MIEYKEDPLFEAWRNAIKMASQVERALIPIRSNEPGVTVEDFKAFTSSGALWLQEQGLIGIEAEDDKKTYYHLLPEVTQEQFDYCVNYWADQVKRFDALLHEARSLKLQVVMEDFDVSSLRMPMPGKNDDAGLWEAYQALLRIKLFTTKARKEMAQSENANNSAQFSSSPSSTPQSSDKNNGCVVLGLLAMLAFAIFLAYACFAN